MSDTEDVPELSAEAKAFLTRHQATVSAIRNVTPRRSAGLPHQVFGSSR